MPNAKSEILNSGSIPSLKTEELAAQRTAFHGRLVALTAIAFLITMLTPWPGPVYFYFLLAVFTLLGWGAYQTAQSSWGRPWHQYGFVTADFALLTFTLLYPNPLLLIELPPQFALRFGSFIYFFTLLAGLAYVYRPQLVLWGGVSAAISWSIGIGFLLALPDTIWRGQESGTAEAVIGMIALPTFIDLGVRVQEVVVLLIVAGLLALAVKRSRAVALRQANLARERANLARTSQ